MEFILRWGIKNLSFIRSWNQVPWVLAGFKSQPRGFKSQSVVNSFIARGPLSIPPSDVYVRSFLCSFLYFNKTPLIAKWASKTQWSQKKKKKKSHIAMKLSRIAIGSPFSFLLNVFIMASVVKFF